MNYAFEFDIIPMIVDNSNSEEPSFEKTNLLNSPRRLQLCFSKYYPDLSEGFDWEHFSIRKEVKSDVKYWLLTFPEPEGPPEAKWGIVVHYKDKPYMYFTLEQGYHDRLFFCQASEMGHKNFGDYPEDLTEEDFIDMALKQANNEASKLPF